MKRVLLLTTIGVLIFVAFSQAQNVFNPADAIVRYSSGQPVGSAQNPDPNVPGLQKWVSTSTSGVSTGSNSFNASSFKAYYINLGGGLRMAFRIKFPRSYSNPDSASKKYPMMVFFHGAGEPGCGTNNGLFNNEKQLLHGGQTFRDFVDNNLFDGFLLYPQIVVTSGCWSAWGVPPASQNFRPVIAMVDSLAKYVRADVNKLVTTGLSDGGAAAFNMAIAYPHRVAKAGPSAAATGATNYGDFVHVPFWFASGGKDTNPLPGFALSTYNGIKNAGGDIQYTLFPDLGHSVWYQHWNTAGFVQWMGDLSKTNPLVYFQRYDFCPDSAISTKIGVTAGFYQYEWQKDGITIATATGQALNYLEPGQPGGSLTILNPYQRYTNYSTQIAPGQGTHIIAYNGYDVTVRSFGSYRVRFRRTNTSDWSDWSSKPAVIFPKPITTTPAIAIDGLHTKVIPAPDGSTSVPLVLPAGYSRYEWYRGGVLSDTGRKINAIAGAYTAKAFEQFGCGSIASAQFKIVGSNGEPKPDPATNLTATVENLVNVRLNWTENPNAGTNETGFEIYKSTGGSGGPYQLLAITPANVTTYLDQNQESNKDYYYIVRAVGDFGAAANTNEATTKTPIDNIAPTAPSGLNAPCINREKVTLRWTASTDNVGVDVYDIYVNGVKAYTTTQTRFEIYQLTPLTEYVFTVKAKDPAGNSSQPSNQVAAYTRAQGVCYKVYQGSWEELPNFNTMTPVAEGISTTGINVNVRPAGLDDQFGIVWEGHLFRQGSTSTYRFRINSDDGSRLYFNPGYYNPNANGHINHDGLHSASNATASNTVSLSSNTYYPFAIAYFEQGGAGETMNFLWRVNDAGSYVTVPSAQFLEATNPNVSLPAAPSGVTANAVSMKQINLTWTDNSNNETGFEVVRALASGGPYVPLATVTGNSYSDTGLNASTQYWYRVRSVNTDGESGFIPNPNVSATTQPPPAAPTAPSGLVASTPAMATVQLQWNDNSANETNFEVWRSVGNNTSFSLLATVPGGAGAQKTYVDAPVFANVHYFYKVRAVVTPTPSGYSNEANASTANSAPVLNPIPDFTVRQGASTTVQIKATDVDGDPLAFNIPGLPYFASIQTVSNGNANLVVSPPEGEQGIWSLRTYVDDGFGGKDTVRLTIVVNDNSLPVLNPIGDVTIDEGDSVVVNLTATDAEMNQYMVWSFQNKPSWVTFTNNGNGNGSLKVKPNYAASGIYSMTVVVDDGFGAWTSRTFNIIVNEVDPNETIQINMRRESGGLPLWNDINILGASTFNVGSLRNKKNEITTVGIQYMAGSGPMSSGAEGQQPGGTGVFPDAILRDVMQVGHNGGSDVANIRINGLDPTKRYNLVFFASVYTNVTVSDPWRGFNANSRTTYSVPGQTAEVRVLGNTNQTDTLYQVQPNASGQITFTMTGDPAGGIGAYLNAMIIQAQIDDGTTPAKPTNLQAQVVPNVGVRLTWNDIAYNENSYRIYRATSATGPYTQLNPDADKDSINYIDPNAAPYTQYWYFIRGVNHLGLGTSSDTVSTITGNNKPSITDLTSITMKTGATGQDDFTVSDNAGDIVTVTVLKKPSWITLTPLGGTSYRLSASPTIDNIGQHFITIQATDNNGGLATQQVQISVYDANTRSAFINMAYNVPAPAPWTNITGFANGNVSRSNLIDENSVATPWGITLVDTWDGVTEWGQRPGNNSGVFPDSVLAGGVFDANTTANIIRFTGLNNSMRYNITMVGSQNAGITAVARYTSGGQVDTLNARNNTNRTANLNGLTPVGGQIEVSITKLTGSTYMFLNGIQIEEYNPAAVTLMNPLNLYAEGRINGTSIELSWSDRSSNETGFEIQRATNDAFNQNLVTTTVPPGASTLDGISLSTGLARNTKYWYRVRALGAGGTFSAWSNKVAHITPESIVHIDFNFSEPSIPSPWNSLDALPNFLNTFVGLLNHANAPTGMTIAVEKIFNSEYPGEIGNGTGNIVPDNVLETSYWIDRGQVAATRLGGLNQSKRYRIGFTGWVDNSLFDGSDFTMMYRVNGRTVWLNTWLNLTKMVWIGDIQPDANGEILIEYTSPDRESLKYGFTSGIVVQAYQDVPGGGTILNSVNPGPVVPEVVLQTPGLSIQQVTPEQAAGVVASRMYPNPFTDQINLDFNNSAAGNHIAVDVYDLSGKIVYRRNFGTLPAGANTLRLNTAEAQFNTGVYVVTLKVNGLPVQATKMIKNRK